MDDNASQYERQIVLDTETTGLEHQQGHRIIEVGCVELSNRKLTGNNFHVYLNPEREIDQGAIEVHGITNEFLDDKPLFSDVVEDLVNYLRDTELIIHNAAFDVGFLDAEFAKIAGCDTRIGDICGVYDTLIQARRMFPGQRNDLDSLCKRYEVDNSQRELHGALLDAEILADVYLAMTGGQTMLSLEAANHQNNAATAQNAQVNLQNLSLTVVEPAPEELENHVQWLARLDKRVEGECVWTRLNRKLQ